MSITKALNKTWSAVRSNTRAAKKPDNKVAQAKQAAKHVLFSGVDSDSVKPARGKAKALVAPDMPRSGALGEMVAVKPEHAARFHTFLRSARKLVENTKAADQGPIEVTTIALEAQRLLPSIPDKSGPAMLAKLLTIGPGDNSPQTTVAAMLWYSMRSSEMSEATGTKGAEGVAPLPETMRNMIDERVDHYLLQRGLVQPDFLLTQMKVGF